MALEKIDKNTYIHKPSFEIKEKVKLKPVSVLSNNLESIATLKTIPMVNQPIDYYKLITYFKETPELISIIDALVTDILSDGWKYYAKGSRKLASIRADEFAKRNNLKLLLKKALTDKFIYGNGYLVISRVDETQVKSALSAKGYEIKSLGFEIKELMKVVDEVSYKNTLIQYLPAVTVSIEAADKFGNGLRYKQTIGKDTVYFEPSQVIHFRDIETDGKFLGYSRLYSLKSELQMLWAAKNYVGKFFDNDGTPNLLYIAQKMKPGSVEYNDFVKQLQEGKKVDNKQRSFLATSDIKIERLNTIDGKMQFESLMKYVTSLIAMTYQMPSTRLGMSAGGNSEEATLTNQGYFRSIEGYHDTYEQILNGQLFEPILNSDLVFNKNYKEDEMREAQILKTRTDVAQQRIELDLYTREAAGQFLDIPVTDMPTEEELAEKQAEQDAKFEKSIESEQYMQGQKKPTELDDEPQKKKKLNKTPNKYK